MSQILLIEPDALLAATYRLALESAGYAVRVAAAAQAAISMADELQPDLVVMELQLVGHNGMEFLYEFRSYADWQAIPVLVISQVPPGVFADSWDVLTIHLGVRQYLHKPRTSLASLLSMVQAVLDGGGVA